MSSTDDVQSARLLGQVKWFNNKAGYGFITVNDGEHSGKDIFIHYSTIRTVNSQYKYLVQGEYVEFNLVKSTTDKHEYQAVDISGIKDGPLMCETRRMNRPAESAGGDEPRIARTSDAPFRGQRRYKTPEDSAAPRSQTAEGFQVVRKRRSAPRGPPKKEAVVQASA
jgi:CspA family cold shock protein